MTKTVEDPNAGLFRVLVVAPMKSGGTYASAVLTAYAGIPPLGAVYLDLDREHVIDRDFADQLRGRSFCMNFHMLPTRFNIVASRRENVALIGMWRNLGDMLVSADDHQFRESGVAGPAGFSVITPSKYTSLGREARYRFLIDALLPWYLGFYLRWRYAGLGLSPYESMVEDPRAFFAELLRLSSGHEAIPARLEAALAIRPGEKERFNVGKAGRSAELFAESTKRLLEEAVLAHPEREQLEILLWELPWEVPALTPVSALDGRVVRHTDDATPYFVSRGIAHPVSASWLASRFGARRTPVIVGDAELASIPRGEPLY
jgi:hypothetical protein